MLRKSVYVLFTVLLLVLTSTQVALAGGWWKVSATDPITAGNPEWRDFVENTYYSSPHGGFTTSSNLCKTCHAVHEAGTNSYRLLKSGVTDFEAGVPDRTAGELRGEAGSFASEEGAGNKRSTECMYCHDATSGLTDLRPYALGAMGATVRGEHTLGATSIPDSDTNGGAAPAGNLFDRNPVANGGNGAELDCYQCHSVHGANTIGHDGDHDGNLDPVALNNKTYDGNDNIESWNTKILRVDPSGDGNPLALGTGGIDAAELANEPTAVRTGFCADCHNRNPNWATTTNTVGPNNTSHIQGRGADGLMEVYGEADVAVAGHTAEFQGCRGCHAASDSYAADSRFPHQSTGWKLMWDSYDDSGTPDLAGDPNRSLPVMDKVCLMCHPVDDEFESGKGYQDVATEQNLCYRCHKVSSFAGAPDVESQFAKASGHPTNDSSGRHTEDEWTDPVASLGAANRHAECIDCHNVDAVLQGQGRPLQGIWGVSVANLAAGLVPTYTKIDGVTLEYELCFKCHSSYTTRPASNYYEYPVDAPINPQPDKALEFNTNNNAFHPVEGAGRNVSSNLNQQLTASGLSTDSIIKCTDCHNSDDTSATPGPASNSTFKPKGPHGSTNAPVLRAKYLTNYKVADGPTSYNQNDYQLCFLCHDASKLMAAGSGTYRTNFSIDGGINNLHRRHLVNGNFNGFRVVCRNCHFNIHSNQEVKNTQYAVYQAGSWTLSNTPPNGVKTHLVNFSPDVVALGGADSFSGFPLLKPQWAIWVSNDVFNGIDAGVRTCSVSCHGYVMFDSSYVPTPAGDDAYTYTP